MERWTKPGQHSWESSQWERAWYLPATTGHFVNCCQISAENWNCVSVLIWEDFGLFGDSAFSYWTQVQKEYRSQYHSTEISSFAWHFCLMYDVFLILYDLCGKQECISQNITLYICQSYGRLFPPENKKIKKVFASLYLTNRTFFLRIVYILQFWFFFSLYHNSVKNRVIMSELRDINS